MTIENFNDLVKSQLICGGTLTINPFQSSNIQKIEFEQIDLTGDETVSFVSDDDSIEFTFKLEEIERIEQMFTEDETYKLLITLNSDIDLDIVIEFFMNEGCPMVTDKAELDNYKYVSKALLKNLQYFKDKPVSLYISNNSPIFSTYDYDNDVSLLVNTVAVDIKELDFNIFISNDIPCVKFTDKQSNTVVSAMGVHSFIECNNINKVSDKKLYSCSADNGYIQIRDAGYVFPNMKA